LEPEKLIAAGLISVVAIVGVIIGATYLTFDPSTSNNDNEDEAMAPDTDLGDLNLEAPNWGLLTSDDEVLNLHDLRGKFVVVDLMQTGECLPCIEQTSHLKELHNGHGDSIEIISLSLILTDTVSRLAQYKSENDIPWFVGLDTSGVFGEYFNVQYVPTLVIIDDEGYFRWYHGGLWEYDDMSKTLSQLDR